MKEGPLLLTLCKLKRIIREYNEYSYANKLNSLSVIDKFTERHKLLKLTQEENENLNRLITTKNSPMKPSFKTSLEEIKEDKNKWKNILCSWIRKLNAVMAIMSKLIYRFNSVLIKFPAVFFVFFFRKSCVVLA